MKTLLLTALTFASFALNPCQAITHTLSGAMDVFQATTNAANTGTGTGTISGDYDSLTKALNYTITWADLSGPVTAMHFHEGILGNTGGPEVFITGPFSSPQAGSDILNATQEADLLAGGWYVNVHTGDFVSGEIRGQVSALAVPEPTSCVLLGVASLLGLSRRRSS